MSSGQLLVLKLPDFCAHSEDNNTSLVSHWKFNLTAIAPCMWTKQRLHQVLLFLYQMQSCMTGLPDRKIKSVQVPFFKRPLLVCLRMSHSVTAEVVNTINRLWMRDITAGVSAAPSKVNQSHALHLCSSDTVNCPSVNTRISSSRLCGPDAITHSWPTIKWDWWLLSLPPPAGLLYTWTLNVILLCAFFPKLFFCDGVATHHASPHGLSAGYNLPVWCPDSDVIAICGFHSLVQMPRCATASTFFLFIFFVLGFYLSLALPAYCTRSYCTASWLRAVGLSTSGEPIVIPSPLNYLHQQFEKNIT